MQDDEVGSRQHSIGLLASWDAPLHYYQATFTFWVHQQKRTKYPSKRRARHKQNECTHHGRDSETWIGQSADIGLGIGKKLATVALMERMTSRKGINSLAKKRPSGGKG